MYIQNNTNPLMTIPALKHYYKYVYKTCLEIEEFPVFPINSELYRGEVDEEKTVYLGSDFDYLQLFDDTFYSHLNFEPIIITLKACMAIGLGAAFDTNQLTELRMQDICVDQNSVKIRNLHSNFYSNWINMNGTLGQYIRTYHNLRIINNNIESDLFFERIWDMKGARHIVHDPDIWEGKKPSHVTQQWISYILKYISNELGLPRIETRHLKVNSVLHYLYNSGTIGIGSLVRTFGWVSFVEKAIKRYFSESDLSELNIEMDILDSSEDGGKEYFFPLPHRMIEA